MVSREQSKRRISNEAEREGFSSMLIERQIEFLRLVKYVAKLGLRNLCLELKLGELKQRNKQQGRIFAKNSKKSGNISSSSTSNTSSSSSASTREKNQKIKKAGVNISSEGSIKNEGKKRKSRKIKV